MKHQEIDAFFGARWALSMPIAGAGSYFEARSYIRT
jgi:hypothetical protein